MCDPQIVAYVAWAEALSIYEIVFISNIHISNKLPNCFALKTFCPETKQLRSLLLTLLIDNMFIEGPSLSNVQKTPKKMT